MKKRTHRVTSVRLVPARPANGLLGYVSCTVAGLRLDGLTLRRTRAGRAEGCA